jgi:hypothetical protein
MTPTDARDDLVERLKSLVIIDEVRSDNSLGREAATRIQQLTARAEQAEAQVERLREALTPFASYRGSDQYILNPDVPDEGVCAATSFRAGDYRKARAALNAKP